MSDIRLALQRALVHHVGAAVRHSVVDQHAVFKVLTGIGEVHAQQIDVAAGCRESNARNDTDNLAAKRCDSVAQRSIPADMNVVRRTMNGIFVPVHHGHDTQLGAVADYELDVVRERATASVVNDADGLGVRLHVNDDMAVGHVVLARTVDVDDDRLLGNRVLREGHDVRIVEVGVRLCCHAVRWGAGATKALVVTLDDVHSDAILTSSLDRN